MNVLDTVASCSQRARPTTHAPADVVQSVVPPRTFAKVACTCMSVDDVEPEHVDRTASSRGAAVDEQADQGRVGSDGPLALQHPPPAGRQEDPRSGVGRLQTRGVHPHGRAVVQTAVAGRADTAGDAMEYGVGHDRGEEAPLASLGQLDRASVTAVPRPARLIDEALRTPHRDVLIAPAASGRPGKGFSRCRAPLAERLGTGDASHQLVLGRRVEALDTDRHRPAVHQPPRRGHRHHEGVPERQPVGSTTTTSRS